MTEQTPATIGAAITDAIVAATGYNEEGWWPSGYPPLRTSIDMIVRAALDELFESNEMI